MKTKKYLHAVVDIDGNLKGLIEAKTKQDLIDQAEDLNLRLHGHPILIKSSDTGYGTQRETLIVGRRLQQ